MRILFFGIYGVGVCALDRLLDAGFDVVAVVTKPDAPDEGQPVAELARQRGVPVWQPTSPREPRFLLEIEQTRPDLLVVSGYHRIIPARILELPSIAAINVHGSLLPRYRGPNPWKWAVIQGETQTGVTVHVMTPELDRGEILAQKVVDIDDEDTGGNVFEKTSAAGAILLVNTIQRMREGTIQPRPQDESVASYHGYPTDVDTRIDWAGDARRIRNLVRGLSPRPGAWTGFGDRRIFIWKVDPTETESVEPPGTVVARSPDGLRVATGTVDVIIREAGLEGGGRIDAGELTSTLALRPGDRFREGSHQGNHHEDLTPPAEKL